MQLSTDKSAVYNIELEEQEKFLKHHHDVANDIIVVVNFFHCSAALDSRVTLIKHNVNFKDVLFECDCGK